MYICICVYIYMVVEQHTAAATAVAATVPRPPRSESRREGQAGAADWAGRDAAAATAVCCSTVIYLLRNLFIFLENTTCFQDS